MEKDKGQNKDQTKDLTDRIGNPLAIWNGSQNYYFILRKSEKIVTALYLVTNLISDQEPIKWKVRGLGNDLLSLNSTIKDKFGAQYDEHTRTVGTTAMELISLLDVAHISGLVSLMNARILKDELVAFVKEIVENQNENLYKKGFLLEGSFFDISKELADQSLQRQKINQEDQKDHSVNLKVTKKDILNNQTIRKIDKGQQLNRQGGPHSGTLEKHNNRRKVILELLRKTPSLSIKDVSIVINDCSEKTLQRELLSLVSEGILEKEGERRWSRYSLAKRI